MKIQGPQFKHIQAYKQNVERNKTRQQQYQRKDELNISAQAKRLQKSEQASQKRVAYLQQIKKDIESGKYEINYEKTAEKIAEFWAKY